METEAIARLVARYLDGATASDLAAEFTIDESTVRAHLQRADVPKRPYWKLCGEQLEEVARRYEAGETQLQLAAAFGLHRGTVRKALLRAGVTLRHH